MIPPIEDPAIHDIRQALERVYDPEFGVSVADLGLIYAITCEGGRAHITMTLTSMYCPAGDIILAGVKSAAEATARITDAEVELVWEPLWTAERLSPAARKHLGWDEY